MFLLITFKRIKLESQPMSHNTQNKISCPKLSCFLKIDEDLCKILSEQICIREKNSRINEQFDVGTNGRMNGQLDGWTEIWTDVQMGE